MISLMANKNANKDTNKNDGQEKENEENTKMFRHITAITCDQAINGLFLEQSIARDLP